MALAVAQLEKLLLENQLLTKAILTEAKQLAQKQGISLEELLVQEGMVPEERLGELMAADYGVPFIDLKGREIEDAVLRFIPENIAAEQKMIAFAKEANSLKVALADPGNVEVISFLAKKTGFDVQPHYAHIADIKLALERYHKEIKQFEDIIASNVEKAQRLAAKGGENLEAIAQDLPVVEIVQTLLENAYRKKASD